MRGVSTPTHEYARVAGMYAHSLTIHPNHRDPSLIDIVRTLTASTRAYTRVILRLRAQAEKEAILVQQSRGLGITMKPSNLYNNNRPSSPVLRSSHSRVSSRAPSPTTSNGAASSRPSTEHTSLMFRSPLFRLRRAPLLRVFVPSPEGDWLSDKSVLACEEEFKRAGVMHLIRLGDVVWDVAVGDEGNVGRLVWDGSYLIVSFFFIENLPLYLVLFLLPLLRPPNVICGLLTEFEFWNLELTFLFFSLTGSRLFVYVYWRSSKVHTCFGISTFLFP